MYHRKNALHLWLKEVLPNKQYILSPLAGDASFRHYYRLQVEGSAFIVMDAPPEKETIASFISAAHALKNMGVRTPEIYTYSESLGLALLEDFGDNLLLNALNEETADDFYRSAIKILNTIQRQPGNFPLFDKTHILNELSLFREWFLKAYLNLTLTAEEENLLQNTFSTLCTEILEQPQVIIHRDYHSRNIMLLENNALGIIDFQDAMQGPFTYDLVSLLKDCYIQWPKDKVLAWLTYFYKESALTEEYSLPSFIRAFDYCGLQRHLKVLGIFSRLYLRDNKPNYLQDLPLTLHYVMACLESYEPLHPFYLFMQNRIQLP